MHKRSGSQLLSLLAAASLLLASISHTPARSLVDNPAVPSADGATTQAEVALSAGKDYLRRNRADQALPQLQNALW
jgi:hypothetical protein